MQADIRRTPGKKRKLVRLIYFIAVALFLIFGLYAGYQHEYFNLEYSGQYREFLDADVDYEKEDIDNGNYDGEEIEIEWFSITLAEYNTHSYTYVGSILEDALGYYGAEDHWFYSPSWDVEVGGIIILIILFGVLFSIPFVFTAICKKACKNTSLAISKEQVVGSYSSLLFKKTLQMPIEKIDNLAVSSNLLDKIRTGKTLELRTASGVIKLHFVQNPQEVVDTAMKQIEDIRGKQERARIISQSVAAPVTASVSDKLQELATMKESGLITQEEFEQKRQDILGKM